MIKTMLLSLLVASCASSSHILKSQNPKNLDFCLDGSKFLHEIGNKEQDLALWRSNSVLDKDGLRLKSGVPDSTLKRIEIIAERTKTQLSSSLPANYPKDQAEDSLLEHLGFCLADRVGSFRIDGVEYITLDKIRPGSFEREELESLSVKQVSQLNATTDHIISAYHGQSKGSKAIDIDLDHVLTFPMTFTYTSMDGLTKLDAQKARKDELAGFFKRVLHTIVSFVVSKPIREFLVKNTPLPPLEKPEFANVKTRINSLLEQVEGVDPLTAHTGDAKVDHFGEGLGRQLEDFYYTEDSLIRSIPSYQARLNKLVKSLDYRSDLFALYLLSVSKVEINRSPDGESVIFNITTDLPEIFKKHKFELLTKHME